MKRMRWPFTPRYLEAAGIDYEVGESAPGRSNIWARLEGGELPGLMLLQHTDVVPADERFWTTPPLEARAEAGYLIGRGVIDMKGTGDRPVPSIFGAGSIRVTASARCGLYGDC